MRYCYTTQTGLEFMALCHQSLTLLSISVSITPFLKTSKFLSIHLFSLFFNSFRTVMFNKSTHLCISDTPRPQSQLRPKDSQLNLLSSSPSWALHKATVCLRPSLSLHPPSSHQISTQPALSDDPIPINVPQAEPTISLEYQQVPTSPSSGAITSDAVLLATLGLPQSPFLLLTLKCLKLLSL